MSDRLEEIKVEMRRIKSDMGIFERAYQDAGGKLGASTGVEERQHNSCPICGDDSGFSIFRSDESGGVRWKCFSKCGKVGGSIVDLVMSVERIDSKEAGRRLRQRYSGPKFNNGQAPHPAGANSNSAPVGPLPKGEGNAGGTPALQVQKKVKKRYMSLNQAADAFLWVLQNRRGHPDAKITQINSFDFSAGQPFGRTVRYEFTKENGTRGKEFSPFRYVSGAWIIGMEDAGPDGARALWPMMNLPLLKKALNHEKEKETTQAAQCPGDTTGA